MKKLITATAAAAFVLATGFAHAEDTKQNSPTQKTGTQQQMETQATSGAKMKATTPAGTTGAGMNAQGAGASKLPGKPTDTIKDQSGK